MAVVYRYALRIDVREGLRERLSSWLEKVATGFICVYEEGHPNPSQQSGDARGSGEFDLGLGRAPIQDPSNPHVHLIIDSDKKQQALRSSFVRAFAEWSGNTAYSLKLCDDDYHAYIRYICKGAGVGDAPVVWYRQGLLYTDALIQEAHAKFYVNQAAVLENARLKRKLESTGIVEQVERECKKKKIKSHDRDGIARVYIRLYRDARKAINVFAAKAVVNTVSLLLDEGTSAEDLLAAKIADI